MISKEMRAVQDSVKAFEDARRNLRRAEDRWVRRNRKMRTSLMKAFADGLGDFVLHLAYMPSCLGHESDHLDHEGLFRLKATLGLRPGVWLHVERCLETEAQARRLGAEVAAQLNPRKRKVRS